MDQSFPWGFNGCPADWEIPRTSWNT